ncbi:MAG: hypothetical protein HY794_19155 [Desulfarculus sp.]|nr:hypothetical protein [Desulfarculus sp.]
MKTVAAWLLILLSLSLLLAGCVTYTDQQKADYQDFEGRRHEMEWVIPY